MGRGQHININKSLKKVNSNTQGWLGGFKTSVKEVTAVIVEKARELEVDWKATISQWNVNGWGAA